MNPITYVLEFDNCLYGPFETAMEAAEHAIKRDMLPFSILELKAAS